MREPIRTSAAPNPIGPYSQGIDTGSLVFFAGQGPMDPATNTLVEGDVVAQTECIMRNIGALLEAAGLGYEDLAKTTCYLADIEDFKAFNEVYGRYMSDTPPARTVIEAARLPLDILVEIEVVAVRR